MRGLDEGRTRRPSRNQSLNVSRDLEKPVDELLKALVLDSFQRLLNLTKEFLRQSLRGSRVNVHAGGSKERLRKVGYGPFLSFALGTWPVSQYFPARRRDHQPPFSPPMPRPTIHAPARNRSIDATYRLDLLRADGLVCHQVVYALRAAVASARNWCVRDSDVSLRAPHWESRVCNMPCTFEKRHFRRYGRCRRFLYCWQSRGYSDLRRHGGSQSLSGGA